MNKKGRNEGERNKKGFTMVELIIVVAVMGVIGALLVPSYRNMATKAKISTDVSTVKTVKRLIDVYNAEGNTPAIKSGDTNKTISENLFNAGYLESKTIDLQTKCELAYSSATTSSASTLKLDVSDTDIDENIKAVAGKMVTLEADSYRDWIKVSQ